MMKVKSLLLSLLLLCALISIIAPYAEASGSQELWALIICGSEGGSFSNNTQYMYHVLNDTYDFNGIYYLDVYTERPGVDASSTRANVRSAITDWLNDHSDENAIIFIYFTSHGSGYLRNYGFGPFIFHITYYAMGDHGRISFETNDEDQAREVSESHFRLSDCPRILVYYDLDDDGQADDFYWDHDNDERIEMIVDISGTLYDGGELPYIDVDGDGNNDDLFADIGSNNRTDILIDAGTWTSDGEDGNNDGIIIGVDFNGDGDFNDWIGIDEGLKVQNETYWDDELASDLNTLSYAKLIFVRQGCVEGGEGCFGGGVIDDISAPNRIIMTATDETHPSYGDMDGDGFSEWSEAFIDALYGKDTYWNGNAVVEESPPVYVDADWNNDGHVSMWEAWKYAWDHDDARLAGWETPWLDDNGNGLPTYMEEHDALDLTELDGSYCRDGLLAYETYFGFEKIKSPDINGDHQVDMEDIQTIAKAFGSYPGHPRWNPDADLHVDDKIRVDDVLSAALMFMKTCSSGISSLSSNSPEVSVCPNETTIGKHETFTVNITVTNVTDLAAYQFELYYNATVLNCTGVKLPPGHFLEPVIDPDNIFTVRLLYDNRFNTTHGLVWVAVTLLGEEPSKNGTGTLATINFTTTAIGSTDLAFQCTKLVNSSSKAMPIIVVDGSVTVLPSLTVLAQDQYNNSLTRGDVYIDDQLVGHTGSTFLVNTGMHEVFVNDFWESGETGYRYGFKNWTDGSVDNPRNITIIEDTTITAHFSKKWCPGDVNGDGKVRVDDVYFVSSRFGANWGDHDWDSRADLNCDDKIRVDDLLIVVANYGNKY